jgi:enoyl-CoA hydratase/carnithine racemase
MAKVDRELRQFCQPSWNTSLPSGWHLPCMVDFVLKHFRAARGSTLKRGLMDGTISVELSGAAGFQSSADVQNWQPTLVDPAVGVLGLVSGLSVKRIEDTDALVITKTVSGFSPAIVAGLSGLVRAAAAGRLGRLKFLVFDFAHDGFPLAVAADGFDSLLAELSNLILAMPVVTVAAARANLAGADLEFALACNMIASEASRRFSFAADVTVSVAAYGVLAQKIGFVRAERLMEKGDIVDAAQMQALYLVKETVEEADDFTAFEAFLAKTARRHNACYGIYRAQRMAIRPPYEALRA